MTLLLQQSVYQTPDGANLNWAESESVALDTAALPVFVLLHPMPVDHRFWIPLVERINKPYRFLLPDLRGHGASTLGTAEMTISRMAEDVIEWLDSLGVKKAIFGGCSIGGYVLFEIWRQRPDLVSALAFLCSKPQPDTEENRQHRMEIVAKVRTGGASFVEEALDGMAHSLVGETSRTQDPDITALVRNMMSFTPEELIAVLTAIAYRADSVLLLPGITVPVLAVAGGEDSTIPPDEVHLIGEKVPNAEFHLVEKAGHYAPFEVPDVVAGLVNGWLNFD